MRWISTTVVILYTITKGCTDTSSRVPGNLPGRPRCGRCS